MAPLVAELERSGFAEVVTIAQSGNVVVTTELDREATARSVEAAVLASSGATTVAVPVGAHELAELVATTRLSRGADPARVLVVAVDRDLPTGAVVELERVDPGRIEVHGRLVVHACPDGVAKAPSMVAEVERRWGASATGRNLRTIERISAALA
jgi:uncharacterized protein (DUF1697 family)